MRAQVTNSCFFVLRVTFHLLSLELTEVILIKPSLWKEHKLFLQTDSRACVAKPAVETFGRRMKATQVSPELVSQTVHR